MGDEIRETVYTPESQLLDPRSLLRSMLADFKASRFLSWRLFVRNLSAQYRRSALGYVWLLIPPIVTAATWMFLTGQRIVSVRHTDIPYPVFVLTSTLLWQVFAEALVAPSQVVQESKAMLVKIRFPHEALILAGATNVLFNFVARSPVLIVIFFWFEVAPSRTIVFVPLGVLALSALGIMIGLMLLPLALLYGDVSRVLALINPILFFLTPVVYPPPTAWPASLIAQVNPVSPLLSTTRQWLTGGDASYLPGFCLVTGLTLALILVAWVVYRLAMPHVIERIGT
jgi:lipopolysaccharide transport system permease protein